MKMVIEGTPKEMADFVLELQNRLKQETAWKSRKFHGVDSDGTFRPPYSKVRYKVCENQVED